MRIIFMFVVIVVALLISGKEIADQRIISEWVNEVKDIVIYPDENQEPRDGFIFSISLFEENSIVKEAR